MALKSIKEERTMKRMKDRLAGLVIAIAVIAAVCLVVFGEKMEPIGDINGPEDYSLAVLTEADLIAADGKRLSTGLKTKTSNTNILGVQMGDATVYFDDDFSGTQLLANWNLLGRSDLVFDLYDFQVTAGNLLICVVHEGQIIGTVEPGEETVNFRMDDVEPGNYEVVIAGESAAFTFRSFDFDS